MSIEEKFNEAKKVIEEWVDKQGEDKCWYYPDLFRRLAVIFDVESTKEPCLPPISQFEKGCDRYREEVYSGRYMS